MEVSFGEFIKQKRQEKNLTQKNLAEMLYVSESAVSKWEKNVARPDISLLTKLSSILGVTEHELINASIDKTARKEQQEAKKWRVLSKSYSLFFLISYAVSILTCFICNLAVNKTLSWFWIVFSALALSFSFTNMPKLIKRHRIILIPLLEFLALVILFAVCSISAKGNWFLVVTISVFLGFIIIFLPIFIAKLNVFRKIKKYADFVSLAIDFIVLIILLLIVERYTLKNGFADYRWFFTLALPISVVVYLALNIILSTRLLNINKYLKTSIVLFLSAMFLYVPPLFIKVNSLGFQSVIDGLNISKADLDRWIPEITLGNNIHLIIFITLLILSLGFLTKGVVLLKKNNRRIEK